MSFGGLVEVVLCLGAMGEPIVDPATQGRGMVNRASQKQHILQRDPQFETFI